MREGWGRNYFTGYGQGTRGHRLSEKNVSYRKFSPPKQRPEAALCYEERLYDVHKEFLGFIDHGRSTRESERTIGKSKYCDQ